MWKCDVMPTISEDSISQRSGQFTGEEANFEQLMVNMLDERDKLMETLRENQDQLTELRSKMTDVEKERDSLQRQLNANLPQEFSSLTRELNLARESLLERDEEIQELKAERNNTRLLLEHLECLVSRHERSLRMTVVKRQAQSPAGVSSEVEVLKALKSLFEHHKALDEKVREKLRVSVDRISALEDDLTKEKEEVNKLRAEKKTNNEFLSNGHVSLNEAKCGTSFDDTSEVADLKVIIEKQSNELHISRSKLTDLNAKLGDLEDQLKHWIQKEAQAKEESLNLRENLREHSSQKEDLDDRISALEKRYQNEMHMQRDPGSVEHKGHDFILISYHMPTTCEVCPKPLWHMFKPPAALECRRCRVKVHKEHLDKKEEFIAPCKVNYDPNSAKELLLLANSAEEQQQWVSKLRKKIEKSGYAANQDARSSCSRSGSSQYITLLRNASNLSKSSTLPTMPNRK